MLASKASAHNGRADSVSATGTKFYGDVGKWLTQHTANVPRPHKGCPSPNLGISASFG